MSFAGLARCGRGTGVGHTHEEVIRLRDITANAEELHQIVKLAVYVAAYLYFRNHKASVLFLSCRHRARLGYVDATGRPTHSPSPAHPQSPHFPLLSTAPAPCKSAPALAALVSVCKLGVVQSPWRVVRPSSRCHSARTLKKSCRKTKQKRRALKQVTIHADERGAFRDSLCGDVLVQITHRGDCGARVAMPRRPEQTFTPTKSCETSSAPLLLLWRVSKPVGRAHLTW